MIDGHDISSRLKFLGFYLCNKDLFYLSAQMNPRKVTFANLLIPQLVEAIGNNIIKKHKFCHTLIWTEIKS